MSDVVISVENLSKHYLVGHNTPQTVLNPDFRQAISRNVSNLVRKTRDMLSGRPIVQGDAVEEFWALNDVSFKVRQGERLGIIGRNGAGKSTLLKVLSRITEPTKGRVRITGRVASLLEVGTGFHPELSGRENIYLNGAMLGMRRAEVRRKFDEIVAFAEVERFLDTPVKRYSSGMYVRLAFAVAAHLEPEILIVDEVLAVGDAQFQNKCIGKMEEVGKDGRTVIFVSHNMTVIQNLCTKAIWLDKGLLHSEGVVTEQIENYLKVGLINTKITRHSTVKCGPDAQLTRLEFSPNIVVSKGKTEFVVELQLNRAVKISALAILVYSALGERVAILDLRQKNGVYAMDGISPLLIKGAVNSMPLVEGVYRVGLYIDYGEFCGNLLELIHLTVTNNPTKLGFATYPSNSRGVVEFDFQIF